jgi:hypothetical protein
MFEQITSSLDYLALKSLAATNHNARGLIPSSTLLTTLLGLELHDNTEATMLKSHKLLACYICLRVLPEDADFEQGFDTNPQDAGFAGPYACTRMCKDCNLKAGKILGRASKLNRLKKKRMGMLEKRGVVLAGREAFHGARYRARHRARQVEAVEKLRTEVAAR